MSDAAPQHLRSLIAAQPSPLVSLTAITALPSRRPPRTFRLAFADGSLLKGRQLDSEAQAARMQRLTALAGGDFSQVLARTHDAVLEEWVPGRALSSTEDTQVALIARCGAMLGRLHALAAPADPADPAGATTAPNTADAADAPPDGVSWAMAKIRDDLHEAQSLGVLARNTARDVRRLAESFRPATASVGIVHVDFCGENLVQADEGRLVCVDNATLRLGPHDYDLARSCTRWPLNARGRQAFLAGYGAHRSAADFLRAAPFWLLQALLVSIAYRARLGSAGVSEPLALLARLLAHETPQDIVHSGFGPPEPPAVGAGRALMR